MWDEIHQTRDEGMGPKLTLLLRGPNADSAKLFLAQHRQRVRALNDGPDIARVAVVELLAVVTASS